MSNEVDWRDAPAWAMYHAIDEDGVGCWYSDKPLIDEFFGLAWMVEFGSSGRITFHKHYTVDDWKKSLTKRP